MRTRLFLDAVAIALFILGVAAAALGYSVLAGKHRLPPYNAVTQAEGAVRALVEAHLLPLDFTHGAKQDLTGARTLDAARTAPGTTFLTLYDGERFTGRLVDSAGKLLHEWNIRFSEAFPQAPHIAWQAADEAIAWHGAHLFPSGDLLVAFIDGNFPYGGGLVKMDKDSKVLWRLPRNVHHDVFVEEDGTIWAPSLAYHDQVMPEVPNFEPGFYEDQVLKISPDGKVLDEFSVLAALVSTPGLLSTNFEDDLDVASDDPTHINNVEILPAAIADKFPMFKAGDLMISLRNINALVIVDPLTKSARWTMVGPFVRQHDPDFLPNGHILVFDNRGNAARRDECGGASRLLEIDPATQAIVWSYDGCSGFPFGSRTRGEMQLLPNGNVLAVEATRGRVFEVTREPKGELVWEYQNTLPGKPDQIGLLTYAWRFPPQTLTFLNGE